MKCFSFRLHFVLFAIVLLSGGLAAAQFQDDFSSGSIRHDPSARDGWAFFAGDGAATIQFLPGDGFASIHVDATADRRNIWWASIRRQVSANFALNQLSEPGYELRIEARVRVSHAPRRVNLHLNTQRTTDFHSHLMEFDIPDNENWHTISMTTRDFDAVVGDRVFGQLALMDWGREKYRVDLDYFKVDIVEVASAGPDQGAAVPYHPPIPDLATFGNAVTVAHDSTIDRAYPRMNFNNWHAASGGDAEQLIAVSGTQLAILRWDLSERSGQQVVGHGLLELTPHTVQRCSDKVKNSGMIRVVEILGGNPNWRQEKVTLDRLCGGDSLDRVLNSQMVIDLEADNGNGKVFATVSQPVLQRMIDGKTRGLAILPLGPINASFYAMEHSDSSHAVTLHFNLQQ